MSTNRGLKRSIAVFGLSFAALTSTFNVCAGTEVPAPPVPETQAKTAAPKLSQAELDRYLIGALNETGEFLTRNNTDPKFFPTRNVGLKAYIDNIKAIVNAGANPNIYPEGGISTFPEGTRMSAVGAAIILAGRAHRPDLVETFLNKGVDVHQRTPIIAVRQDGGKETETRTTGGWGPMDFAIMMLLNAQGAEDNAAPSTANIDNAVKIVKLLHDKGLRPQDATRLTNGSTARTSSYAKLAAKTDRSSFLSDNGLVLRSLLLKNGLIEASEYNAEIEGDPQNIADLRVATAITDDFIIAHGGHVNKSFPDAVPGGPAPITVVAGETLQSLASRFYIAMGLKDAGEAILQIAALNKIALDPATKSSRPLVADEIILVPMPPTVHIGYTMAKGGGSLQNLAKEVQNIYYKQNLGIDKIATDIAIMNGVDPARIGDKTIFKELKQITIGYINDTYHHFSPLTPPTGVAPDRRIDLLVTETPDDAKKSKEPTSPHVKQTFRVAASTGYALNRQVDPQRFHILADPILDYPVETSAALKMLLNAGQSPLRDRIVFSVSMAGFIPGVAGDAVRARLTADHTGYESTRILTEHMEESKPTIFTASGNFRIKEGRYIQSFATTHSPHSVIVGSVGQYIASPDGKKARIMSPYTSYAADVCGPLPSNAKEQNEGTSFATPLTASVYRQFNEWYGNRLSFEEIMAAGLMSAERDFLDYNNVPAMQYGINAKSEDTPPAEMLKTQPAKFRSNGAGLPHNEFCGSGVINPLRWQKALDTMLTLKKAGQDAEGRTFKIPLGIATVQQVSETGRQEYTYKIHIPQDMTLGRLTFIVPQDKERRSEIVVKTPAGFEMQMPKAMTDIISTFAFAYEDAKAGSIMEIRTNYPFGEDAGIMLRGHAPGNAIAALRDTLRAQNILPAPLIEMNGDTVVGPSQPITVLRSNEKAKIDEQAAEWFMRNRRRPSPD